ncbi:hypothetical protein D3C71_1209940 [compost metagenome]
MAVEGPDLIGRHRSSRRPGQTGGHVTMDSPGRGVGLAGCREIGGEGLSVAGEAGYLGQLADGGIGLKGDALGDRAEPVATDGEPDGGHCLPAGVKDVLEIPLGQPDL